MDQLIIVTFLALGATADSYGSANAPIKISYESLPFLSTTSYSTFSRSSSPSVYSQPASSGPSAYSQSSGTSIYSPPPSLSPPSYYSAPSSSPSSSSSYSLSSSPYGYASGERNAAILNFNRNIQPSNADTTSFTTSNGISNSHNVYVVRRPSSYQDEYGQTVQSDTSIAMNGHSYHQSPEGMHVSLTWSADENGFTAQGDHLPQSVQLPAAHAEAHRQARLLATQSTSGGYRGSSSNAVGYGGSSSAPGYGGSSSAPAYGGSSSAPAYGGSSSAPAYGGSSSAPGYGGSSSAPAYGGSSSAPAYGGRSSARGYGRSSSHRFSTNYGPSAQAPALSYASYNNALSQQSSYRRAASKQPRRGYY